MQDSDLVIRRKNWLFQPFFKRASPGKSGVLKSLCFYFLLLPLLLVQHQAKGQVLTLNRNECTKIEARFRELVPSEKYNREPGLSVFTCRVIGLNEEEEDEDLPYTVTDSITVFFIWQNNSILRILARKEKNNQPFKKINRSFSLPVSSFSGQPARFIDYYLFKLRTKGNSKFYNSIVDGFPFRGDLGNVEAYPLVLSGGAKGDEYYRIFELTGFNLTPAKNSFANYNAFIAPVFTFEHSYTGYTLKERHVLNESEPEPYDLTTRVKRYVKRKSKERKPEDLVFKLTSIYKHLFGISRKFSWRDNKQSAYEGYHPVPYFTSHQLKEWERYFLFTLNLGYQERFEPLFFNHCVNGYYAFDKITHQETEGYIIVPGKFFLPRRLQILAVDDNTWHNYNKAACR